MDYKEQTFINHPAKIRNSSIELLKIIAILLIVVSHVVQTLYTPNDMVNMQDYILGISTSTTNIQCLILAMLQSSGAFGNTIFFICSAWFLLDSSKVNKKKMLQMLLDIWVVSIIILITVYFLRGGDIGLVMIIKQIFPITFQNNWYVTCYLLFYPIHPFLNLIISKINQKTLFRTSFILSFLYIGVNFVQDGHFFTSRLILWVTLYLVIAYMKYYLVDISNDFKINIRLFIVGFVGNYGIIALTNFLGLHIGVFNDKLLRWGSNCSPFIILMVIGMLNIARNIHFENSIVNYISKLSLLIYIIHENILLRTYYRPLMWQWVYTNMGYSHVLLWTIILTVIVFTFGLVASIIYKNTIQKCVTKFINATYPSLCKKYAKFETLLLRLH